jgi:hypothetical protein
MLTASLLLSIAIPAAQGVRLAQTEKDAEE